MATRDGFVDPDVMILLNTPHRYRHVFTRGARCSCWPTRAYAGATLVNCTAVTPSDAWASVVSVAVPSPPRGAAVERHSHPQWFRVIDRYLSRAVPRSNAAQNAGCRRHRRNSRAQPRARAKRETWTHTRPSAVSSDRKSAWAADDAWEEAWQETPPKVDADPDRRAWSVEELDAMLGLEDEVDSAQEPQMTEDEAEVRTYIPHRVAAGDGGPHNPPSGNTEPQLTPLHYTRLLPHLPRCLSESKVGALRGSLEHCRVALGIWTRCGFAGARISCLPSCSG